MKISLIFSVDSMRCTNQAVVLALGVVSFLCLDHDAFASPTTLDVSSNEIRLGLGSDPATSMVVSWVTWDSVLGNSAASYRALVATTPADLDTSSALSVNASSSSYNITDNLRNGSVFTPTTVYNSPLIHHAVVVDLQPNTTYFYKVTVENGLYSPMFNFSTPAPRGSLPAEHVPSVTVICGDVGQTMHSRNTLNAIMEHRGYAKLGALGAVEFGILVGDMSYADGNSTRWDTWGEMMQPLSSHFPMMFGVGNHEIELDYTPGSNYLKAFTHYRNRFHMPGDYEKEVWFDAPPQLYDNWLYAYNFSFQYEYGASYYSYDVGLVHYVMLNTYNTYCSGPGCPQYEFLAADLASVDRSVTPWIVVTMHAPTYNSNVKHPQGTEIATVLINEWAQPLFVEYNVNFVFAGHVHAYERFGHVGLDGKSDPTGRNPLYVTIGDGGNHESLYDEWDPSLGDISAFRNGQYYGYGTLTVFNESVAKWEWRPNPYEGTAVDGVVAINYALLPPQTTSHPRFKVCF